MIHLVFVKIHPRADGNGRSARLLEKWFLAVKLGKRHGLYNRKSIITSTIRRITIISVCWV
ncbi:Fic family protein [Chitinophaga lutea]|uniref:Fic family protein n=1 Tax=Chitinophaga lutea TaxID=2488634 RepID=UPI001C706049